MSASLLTDAPNELLTVLTIRRFILSANAARKDGSCRPVGDANAALATSCEAAIIHFR
jgi:hypothetical protein